MNNYGDSTVETPNLDKLASDGALFTHCYATAPVCSPCRSAVITGCYQTTLGIHQHRSSRTKDAQIFLPDFVRTIPEFFREAGYYTYNHGKDDYNFVYDRKDFYAGFPHEEIYFYGGHGKGDWTERKEGQPFFGQITLLGGKVKQYVLDSLIADPIDPATVKVPPYLPDSKVIRNSIAEHYNQIIATDLQVAEIVNRLKEDGLYSNTIIFFFSDHGCDLPRNKQYCYEGGTHVPLSITWGNNRKVIQNLGNVRDDLTSLLDVSATTLALAGFEIPLWMESKNLFAKDYKRDYVISARDRCDWSIDHIRAVRTEKFRYIRNYLPDRPYIQGYLAKSPPILEFRVFQKEGKLTDAQSQFVADTKPEEELYDIMADPFEINNLANDPSYQKDLEIMQNTLDNWIRETGDKGQFPESKEALQVILNRWKDRHPENPEFIGLE